jgi:hypothetical protein
MYNLLRQANPLTRARTAAMEPEPGRDRVEVDHLRMATDLRENLANLVQSSAADCFRAAAEIAPNRLQKAENAEKDGHDNEDEATSGDAIGRDVHDEEVADQHINRDEHEKAHPRGRIQVAELEKHVLHTLNSAAAMAVVGPMLRFLPACICADIGQRRSYDVDDSSV